MKLIYFFWAWCCAWAKIEGENPSGSHKHRLAAAKVESLRKTGRIGHGQAILLLSSSGRMAEAFAMQTADIDGVRLIIVSDKLSPDALLAKLRKFSHVELIVVDKPDSTNSHLEARLRVIDDLKKRYPHAIYIDQYSDELLPIAYLDSLVEEVLEQTTGHMSIIFVPTGTGATLRAFDLDKFINGRRYIIQPVDAEGSSLFRKGNGGRHYSGYGNGRQTEYCRSCTTIADPIYVDDVEVARMANWLLITQQLCVGPSSAAAAAAFVQAARRFPSRLPHWGIPVLIFPDHGEPYMDSLYNDDWLIANGLGKAITGP